uniref:Toll-like receptor n=1 Tax=Anadara kagoshimensis TaxID=1390362 RepID=A0A7H0S6E2_9BIVA|nr:toll-like receptor [Anadara sativa]
MDYIIAILFIVISMVFMNALLVNEINSTMTKNQIKRGENIGNTSLENEDRDIICRNGHFCANSLCICHETEASCSGHGNNLHYIPELPQNITSLEFTKNQLSFVNMTSLRNASNLHLTKLDLSDNNIVNATHDAFTNFKYLEELDLSRNKDILSVDVMALLPSLKNSPIQSLLFFDMGWSEIPRGMFSSLIGSKWTSINLSLNKLEFVQGSDFSRLKHLVLLNLASNKLHYVNLTGLDTVRFLILSGNLIFRVPNFCVGQNRQSAVPSLEELDLDDNKIDFITKETFMCLDNLIKLMLRKNPILNIKNNFMQPLRSLQILYLSEIGAQFSHLKIQKYAFNSSSLQRLYFKRNYLYPVFYNPKLLFANCPNLRYLILSLTQMPTKTRILKYLLSPLKKLEVLRMDFTGLDELPEGVFSEMNSLMELSLMGNKIHSWNGTKVFKKLKLNYLSLRKNQIAIINETSFPRIMMITLQQLDLSENPFSCSCSNLPSIKWLNRRYNLLLGYPVRYKCGSPPPLKDSLVKDYDPSPESCKEKDITLLVALPVSLVSVFTFTSMLSIYKMRWRLRYWLFMIKRRRKGYEPIPNSENCVYSGFVIYSDSDRQWVHTELLHRMEDIEGFRLCIRHRDFDVGKVHVDNIVDNMVMSEKIIVVLSNNFAADEWCHLQLLLAETRLLKENIDVLVLVMLDEINSDCLRASLFKLVSCLKYTPWSLDGTGNCLFWEQLISEMKAPTVIN